jgi:uncharacterized membrane protein
MGKQKTVRRLLISSILISLLGFFDAIYLLYSDLVGVIYCPLEEGMLQCGKVQEWIELEPLILHPSLWGTLFYLAVIALLFLSVSQNNPYWLGFFLPLAGIVGLGFSIFLTFLEIFVIKYFCEFCIFSALCTLTLFILIIIAKKMKQGSIFANLDFWNMYKKVE